jgi:outer membrane receptor protein involved in Fe transport
MRNLSRHAIWIPILIGGRDLRPNLHGLFDVAQAQDTSAPASTALEEITVTAQKREQNLQAVPISMTVVTGKAHRGFSGKRPP